MCTIKLTVVTIKHIIQDKGPKLNDQKTLKAPIENHKPKFIEKKPIKIHVIVEIQAIQIENIAIRGEPNRPK